MRFRRGFNRGTAVKVSGFHTTWPGVSFLRTDLDLVVLFPERGRKSDPKKCVLFLNDHIVVDRGRSLVSHHIVAVARQTDFVTAPSKKINKQIKPPRKEIQEKALKNENKRRRNTANANQTKGARTAVAKKLGRPRQGSLNSLTVLDLRRAADAVASSALVRQVHSRHLRLQNGEIRTAAAQG